MTMYQIVQWVIEHFEGFKYTDDPVDTGGATKFGITLRTLAYYRKHYKGLLMTTKADVKALTLEEAIDVGVKVFAEESGIATIDDWRVRFALYDYAFHSGAFRAISDLQKVVGADPDGKLGPLTRKAVIASDLLRTALNLLTAREEFMQDIMLRKSTQRRFMLGWWIRTTKVQRKLLET